MRYKRTLEFKYLRKKLRRKLFPFRKAPAIEIMTTERSLVSSFNNSFSKDTRSKTNLQLPSSSLRSCILSTWFMTDLRRENEIRGKVSGKN